MDKLKGLNRASISPLGKIAYYWAAETAQLQDEVIISAHGGIKQSAGPDLPADFTLIYYVDHGHTQDDFGIGKFAAPVLPQPFQRVEKGNDSYNYELQKYQGKHNKGGETYSSIQGQSTRSKEHNAVLDEEFRLGIYPANVAGKQRLFDVVTIRNRWWNFGSDLKTILPLIRTHRNKDAIIHCFFCRSFM